MQVTFQPPCAAYLQLLCFTVCSLPLHEHLRHLAGWRNKENKKSTMHVWPFPVLLLLIINNNLFFPFKNQQNIKWPKKKDIILSFYMKPKTTKKHILQTKQKIFKQTFIFGWRSVRLTNNWRSTYHEIMYGLISFLFKVDWPQIKDFQLYQLRQERTEWPAP